MRLVGYIDGERRFVRDEVTQYEANVIAAYIKELADHHKGRLVLFLQDATNIVRMINPMEIRR